MHRMTELSENFTPYPKLDFAWVELTNVCNLRCNHCYNASGPHASDRDFLTPSDYVKLLSDIRETGCRKIQFIGGEPTLNPALPSLIRTARRIGFEFIEVFTNLVRLPSDLIDVFTEHDVAIATSFYSHDADTHDRITKTKGSHHKTTKNIRRIVSANLDLRVGVIIMGENREHYEEIEKFLYKNGVIKIGVDYVRKIGRAKESGNMSMTELCGQCAGGIISIGPDGVVSPCNMSKHWSVGSILEQPLGNILAS